MEKENISQNTGNKISAEVVVILVEKKLCAFLAEDVNDAEERIKITNIDFTKKDKSDKRLMGIHRYGRTDRVIPIYDLPRILDVQPFIPELRKMQETKKAHMIFFEKLKKICEQRIKTLKGESFEGEGIDINTLQTDHTQCDFGKALFRFLDMFERHVYICDYLKKFIEPHKLFHSKVMDIKSNLNNADKIQEIFEEIENKIYPEIIELFENFDKEVESEISRNIYIFCKTKDENVVGFRVHKALLLCQLEFELSEVLLGEQQYIAIDKENKLNIKQSGGEPNIVQLLNVDKILESIQN